MDLTGPAILSLLRQNGRMHFSALCSDLGVRGLTEQGVLVNLLAQLRNQGLIVTDKTELHGWESDASFELSPSVPELVRVLGISLKELSARDPQRSVLLTPFFGRPADMTEAHATDLFVLMPFIDELAPIYQDHIKRVAKRLELSVKRGDDVFSAGEVMKDVWDSICNAKVVIADCTGRNPNVFYEMGLAHTVGKPIILITQNADDVPFDLRSIRYIAYKYTPPGMKVFERVLAQTIEACLQES